MKLLYWTDLFWPQIGGIESLSLQLLPRLQAGGIEPTVLTSLHDPALPDIEEHAGIPIHRLRFQPRLGQDHLGAMAQTLRQVTEFKRRLQPDVVHLHLGGPIAFFHLRTCSAWDAPTVVTLHFCPDWQRYSEDSILAQCLAHADHVVGVSQAVLGAALAGAPSIAGKASVIYNGVAAPERGNLPAASSVAVGKPLILCLGRLVREKGFDLMLAAFAGVLARQPAARLIVAGDGPEREALEVQAQRLGLGRAVRFAGWVDDRQRSDLLEQAAVVVIPSRWPEPFPLVALEAAWMGRPVVAARAGGLPEAVQHGQTGLLVEPENSQALAEAVLGVLCEPERAGGMGRAARELAQARFRVDRTVNEYCDLYHSLLAKGRDRDALSNLGG